jgi:hypothetical protein
MAARSVLIYSCILFLIGATAWSQQPRLTIYNQNFAVIRVQTPLDLKQGVNNVQVSDVTAFLEPDSVILRDPSANIAYAFWNRTTAPTL